MQGVGLCHGISGNAYALLALHKLTGNSSWLARAQYFAEFTAEHWEELLDVPDAPLSLYEVRALPFVCIKLTGTPCEVLYYCQVQFRVPK